MARKKDESAETPNETPASVALPADAAAAIYRDKSGQPFSTIGSEGASYLGAVTEQARSILNESPKDAASC